MLWVKEGARNMRKNIMKGIAMVGVLLMGGGLYAGADLWVFLLGLLLVIVCAVSGRELRKFVRSLLDAL